MIDDMGIFRTDLAVAHVARPEDQRILRHVMVDTGSEYNWIPRVVLRDLGIAAERVERFETVDGSILEREIAFAGGQRRGSVAHPFRCL